MSKFPGGIFSKARGKTAGIVFSAARTRQGKLMTSRQLVIPANPQTAPQQANRGIFNFAQAQVRNIGPGIYRTHWNRAVEDLPGYQSLISLIRRSYIIDSEGAGFFLALAENVNPDSLLGDLHTPDTITIENTSATETEFTWSTELGDNGQNSDTMVCISLLGTVDEDDTQWWSVVNQSQVRSDGSATVTHPTIGGSIRTLNVMYAINFNNESPFQRSSARWSIDTGF